MKDITVLIPDGEHSAALNVVRGLGLSRRVTIEVVSSQRKPAAGLSRYCRRIHFLPPNVAGDDRCSAIQNILAKSPVDVLLPVSIEGTRRVVAAKEDFSARVALPPLPDPASLETANDKAALCLVARRTGVAVPPFLVYPDEVTDRDALERLPYPVLLKHPSSEGGRNIQLFSDAQSLADHIRACADTNNGKRQLLQSYVRGADYGLNVLCREGEILAYTVQKNPLITRPPFGPAAGIHFVHEPRVLEAGRRMLSALAWSGVANLDLLCSEATGEMMLLEMNPRYWGTLLGSVHAGVNFPYLACLAALGRPLPENHYRLTAYADRPVALNQILQLMAGRSSLPGLRIGDTALSMALADPLPSMDGYFRRRRS